jgi:hypothetical protein
MRPEALLAAAAGIGVAAAAGLAALLWLRRRIAAAVPAPRALLEATAVRFGGTLAGALALALGWRSEARAALLGVGAGYLALLALETRWVVGKYGSRTGE